MIKATLSTKNKINDLEYWKQWKAYNLKEQLYFCVFFSNLYPSPKSISKSKKEKKNFLLWFKKFYAYVCLQFQ